MVDAISIALDIISFGMKIKEIVDEVKAFKEYAERLQFKIEHFMSALEPIAEMENQRKALVAAQKRDPEMKAFTKSLSDMLSLVEEVKAFIDGIKEMNAFQKTTKKDKIKKTYETLDYKLDVLKGSIHMGVVVEFKKEADAGRNQDSVKILVRHVKKASASHGSSTGGAKRKSKSPDDIPIIISDDLEPIRKLGEGGFGEVWLSKYKRGERVAVKIFDVGNNRSILKEAAKMRQVVFSPYIVRLRGLIDEPETQGIVMDYFEYGSLESFLPYLECDCWPRRVRMLCDIASGINYLHTDLMDPLVHHDIKLSNMFVEHGFTVKLGDLGLASSGTTVTKSQSQAYLLGTYSHMAPEVWAGKAGDAEPALDIYGFGISIYEFITGKSPWPPAVKLVEIRGLVLSNERPNLALVKPNTPSEVIAMMKKCWKTDPKSRPTSQEILQSFSLLYESRYEAGRLQADFVIRSKIEAEQSCIKPVNRLNRNSQVPPPVPPKHRVNTNPPIDQLKNQVPPKHPVNTSSPVGHQLAAKYSISPNPPIGHQVSLKHPVSTDPPVGHQVSPKHHGSPNPPVGPQVPPKYPVNTNPPVGHQVSPKHPVSTNPPVGHQVSPKHHGSPNPPAGHFKKQVCGSAAASSTASDESDMTWQYRHTIHGEPGDWVNGCHMISQDQLAVCMRGKVRVYKVTSSEYHLMYTIASQKWKGKDIMGVTVSESLPSSLLVICEYKPYVYQCPCQETTKAVKKYKPKTNLIYPSWCIVANANTAIMATRAQHSSFTVCKLPGFTQQSCVQTDFSPYDLSITCDFLVLAGVNQIVVRSLSDVRQDMCSIKPPDGWRFRRVCCRNNARGIYAACVQGRWFHGGFHGKGSVYRYTWDGEGKPKYGDPTCIIEGLGNVRCLSVTSDGLLAVGQYYNDKVKIYKLQ